MEFENINDTAAGEDGFLEGLGDSGGPEKGGTAESEVLPEIPAEAAPPVEAVSPVRPVPPAGAGISPLPVGAGLPGTPAGMPPREAGLPADLRVFTETFPDAARNPGSIPREVWAMARRTGSLTAAYGAWEQVLRHNAGNAARSAGSMRSAGFGSGHGDPFLEGWNE